jgi:glycosyltransferase involved in cell wall biosynthesis
MVWRWALPSAELSAWVQHALCSVAPLKECARNVWQGCAPLKILESMAAAVPVIASNLSPVRELMQDGVEGRLIAPDRPAELSRAIRVLHAYPARAMGERGRARVHDELTWEHALARLRAVYHTLAPALPSRDDTLLSPLSLT